MQKSSASEKSRGVVLFAFNNANTNYVQFTEHTVKLIKHTLKLPVTLITGPTEVIDFPVDNIIRIEVTGKNTRPEIGTKRKVEWRNFGRHQAYDLSPYDETLLIDTDYLVLDSQLLKYFELDWDYLIPNVNQFLGKNKNIETMGPYSLPYIWATIVFFRKTSKAKMLFDMVGRVQRNYDYYKKLYNAVSNNYRNDYAFAIADYVINGNNFNIKTQLNRTLLSVDKIVTQLYIKDELLYVKCIDSAYVLSVQNLHILGKDYLLSDDFKEFVEKYCNE